MQQLSSDESPQNQHHDYPKALDAQKLIAALEAQINTNESERDNAVNNGWYEKASRLELINEGIKKSLSMIYRGDFYERN